MPQGRPHLTLGGHLKRCRMQLGLSQHKAARRAGVSRTTWRAWENDERAPEAFNHARIEQFCGWQPGSVEAVLEGRRPALSQAGLATVTTLHPGAPHVRPDDEFVQELRTMGMSAQVLDRLIASYWEEKAGADMRRQERYRSFARAADG